MKPKQHGIKGPRSWKFRATEYAIYFYRYLLTFDVSSLVLYDILECSFLENSIRFFTLLHWSTLAGL